MSKVRISVVQYLNTAPLVYGFTHGLLRGKYELSFTVPSQCAEALRTGAADVAIIPAIEYPRMVSSGVDLVALPDLAIASKEQVRSLLMISQKPMNEVRRMALDRSSRSTQALVKILCARHWHIAPEFVEAEPELTTMLRNADAAMMIGDPALRLSLNSESRNALRIYDVVEEWRAMTGPPAVLAVWAGRRETITAEVVADFVASRDLGIMHIDEISAEASRELQLPAVALAEYLRRNIDFSLDDENRRGLELYFRLAAELGLIPEPYAVRWVTSEALTTTSEQARSAASPLQ